MPLPVQSLKRTAYLNVSTPEDRYRRNWASEGGNKSQLREYDIQGDNSDLVRVFVALEIVNCNAF